MVGAARRAGVPVLVVAGAVGPGGMDAEATGPGVEVVSLVDRFGPARAMSDPADAVEEVVAGALSERSRQDRRGLDS